MQDLTPRPSDLAALYGVTTKRLNEQVKRNADRFPGDFMVKLTTAEKAEVVANCDRLAKLRFSKVPPYAFTDGAIQAANVLAVGCRRRFKCEPPCRSNFEPGVEADFETVGCG